MKTINNLSLINSNSFKTAMDTMHTHGLLMNDAYKFNILLKKFEFNFKNFYICMAISTNLNFLNK